MPTGIDPTQLGDADLASLAEALEQENRKRGIRARAVAQVEKVLAEYDVAGGDPTELVAAAQAWVKDHTRADTAEAPQ
ncbi:hypothetical protein G9U51_08245 [Calidifontibacter sp. DB0510]|uniref:Uncharacterized protein n=1 Tax=Metallococcus carri TaxID=1656884 RepID=A0A967B1W0_9MICO|nr:hypothetical protein [Metallococcus carri]NHN55758.1 hypothetical protein [Metallococcus carri]NHN55765.1 hypothetical protein [Metallococcus carri]NOP38546.1 hypothetical protein [Calidifontibacter sp. DB2511S]NOP38553.1 hypothetical protein [Calidifontibacter sp. DB2511S]